MKTPFSRFRIAFAAAAAAHLVLLAPPTRAAEPREVFERNRETILATNSVSAEEFMFCVGRVVSEDRLGAAVGFGKARALAWAQLDSHLFSVSEWPTNATPEECRTVWLQYRQESQDWKDVRGGEIVFETQTEPGRWLVVLAIPHTETAGLRPSPETLKKAIDDMRSAGKRKAGRDADSAPAGNEPTTEPTDEPRGLWEQNGVLANETMSGGQF